MATNEGSEPDSKRRKSYNKSEVVEILKTNGDDVNRAVEEIIKELSPFDVTDDNVTAIEDRLDRLEKVSKKLKVKLYKLRQDVKNRKFRYKPEVMDEKEISCSQYTVLQSSDSSEDDLCGSLSQSQITDLDYESEEPSQSSSRPRNYKKKPLNQYMSQRARRRRVSGKREVLEQWASEEGISVSELLGYLFYLENWIGGDR